jgi:chromosome segregation ATPase
MEKFIQDGQKRVQEYQINLVLEEAQAQASNVQKRYQDVEGQLREQVARVEALANDPNADQDALAVARALQTRLEGKQAEVRKDAEQVSYQLYRTQQQAEEFKADMELQDRINTAQERTNESWGKLDKLYSNLDNLYANLERQKDETKRAELEKRITNIETQITKQEVYASKTQS